MENLLNLSINKNYVTKKDKTKRQVDINRWGTKGIKTAEMFRELRNSKEFGTILKGPWEENINNKNK